jgi:hypothetical protein
MQVHAQLGGALLELAGGQHRDDFAADRAGQRVAAERRAVLAGPVHAKDLAGGHHRRDRHDSTAERLALPVLFGGGHGVRLHQDSGARASGAGSERAGRYALLNLWPLSHLIIQIMTFLYGACRVG